MTRADSHPEHLLDRLHLASLQREQDELLRRHCTACVSCDLERRFEVYGWVNALPDETDHALGHAVLDRFFGDTI